MTHEPYHEYISRRMKEDKEREDRTPLDEI